MNEDNKDTTSRRGAPVKGSEGKLTPKQKKFVKYYKELGNGTKAAILAGYSEKAAAQQAYENLNKPHVLRILNDAVEEAEGVIRDIMNDTTVKADTRLAAARDTLDRTVGKPIQRSESVSVNITVESMLDQTSSEPA